MDIKSIVKIPSARVNCYMYYGTTSDGNWFYATDSWDYGYILNCNPCDYLYDEDGYFSDDFESDIQSHVIDCIDGNDFWEWFDAIVSCQTEIKPITVNDVYTGGNVWVFYGDTSDGQYYLCDGNGYIQILDENPEKDFEETWYHDWQKKHTTMELGENAKTVFCINMFDLLYNDPNCGMTKTEIDACKKYML